MPAEHHSVLSDIVRACGALLVVFALAPTVFGQNDYVVGAQDVLTIQVFEQADLAGKYPVETDGSIAFPLIGRVKVGGLTLRETEALLKKELADGYFRNPQVSVAVEQYRSQRVFIVGEVRNSGTHALTGEMTLIEALARAGSVTDRAGDEALIVRSKSGVPDGPVLPGTDSETATDAEVTRVDIRDLQSGRLSQNVVLRDNDTVFVPPAELVYISGQVKNAGSYPLKKGMSVLQVLTLAGGVTDRGATGRISARRLQDGKIVDVRLKLEDPVLPGDTIIVPERFF